MARATIALTFAVLACASCGGDEVTDSPAQLQPCFESAAKVFDEDARALANWVRNGHPSDLPAQLSGCRLFHGEPDEAGSVSQGMAIGPDGKVILVALVASAEQGSPPCVDVSLFSLQHDSEGREDLVRESDGARAFLIQYEGGYVVRYGVRSPKEEFERKLVRDVKYREASGP